MDDLSVAQLSAESKTKMIEKLYFTKPLRLLFAALICLSSGVAGAQSSAPTLKAVVVHEYGGPKVLKYEDVPRPEPKENQILVRVMAAGVNPVDGMIRSGMFAKYEKDVFPMILGADIAGVVEKAGSKITKFKAGDPVFAYVSLNKGGGYAEYVVVTEGEAAPKPKSLNYVEAAAVPVVALTAWQALIDTAKLSAGQTVLIHGGLGADVAIDYTKTRFEDVAKDVDVVLDSVGKDTLARSYGVVKKDGFIVTIVAQIDQAELDKHKIRGASLSVEPNPDELAKIGRLIDEKKIKVIVSQTFPLSEAMKAQEQVATGHTRGKIVLKVADEPK